jgi:hypothetical protein
MILGRCLISILSGLEDEVDEDYLRRMYITHDYLPWMDVHSRISKPTSPTNPHSLEVTMVISRIIRRREEVIRNNFAFRIYLYRQPQATK